MRRLSSHPSVDGRNGVGVVERLARVADVEVRLQVVLPKSLRNQLVRILLLHEVPEPQVPVRARLVLHPLGVMVAGLRGGPEGDENQD